jgi:small conductance mechanosensitive channel
VIPNGEDSSFGNFDRGYVRAVVEVGVVYEQNTEKGMKALE